MVVCLSHLADFEDFKFVFEMNTYSLYVRKEALKKLYDAYNNRDYFDYHNGGIIEACKMIDTTESFLVELAKPSELALKCLKSYAEKGDYELEKHYEKYFIDDEKEFLEFIVTRLYYNAEWFKTTTAEKVIIKAERENSVLLSDILKEFNDEKNKNIAMILFKGAEYRNCKDPDNSLVRYNTSFFTFFKQSYPHANYTEAEVVQKLIGCDEKVAEKLVKKHNLEFTF